MIFYLHSAWEGLEEIENGSPQNPRTAKKRFLKFLLFGICYVMMMMLMEQKFPSPNQLSLFFTQDPGGC